MNEEEKKTIKTIEELLRSNEPICEYMLKYQEIEAMQKLLNLIEKQQKEIEKKDRQIDLMAEWIEERCFYCDEYSNSCEIIQDSCYKDKDCKECIKQYFKNKAEEEK